jgi:hypothetical protein
MHWIVGANELIQPGFAAKRIERGEVYGDPNHAEKLKKAREKERGKQFMIEVGSRPVRTILSLESLRT